MACEQGLDPLRRTIEQLKLKDQEAMLMQSQFELQLREAAADEASLESGLADSPRPAQLQAEITRLQNEIAALGAVNLAALEELTQAQARSEYLAAQCADLLEAVTTLEDAIRRIDQESRARLKETFDTVNQHMGELFPQLFGGGQARLILTGDELLDSGVQVFTQPPGKKNTSIHLLSGGEKTLTALSLVFAMFKLNPAPFCLLDEVDAPLDDANTERYCNLVKAMSDHTQFLFITHNRVTMEMAQHLAGVTMQEQGVSRIVAVDVDEAVGMVEAA
jgi:chromosome segregation protein